MPIALDPNESWPYVLTSDRIKPAPQPTVMLRHLTVGQWRRLNKFLSAPDALDGLDADGVLDQLTERVKAVVLGWRNLAKPPAVDEMLTSREMWEILRAALVGPESESEKNDSGSPSPTSSGASVPPSAPAKAAPVASGPPKPNPPSTVAPPATARAAQPVKTGK